ncbi:MAG: ArsR/SmtB family transcription factor [Candidatus Heimdallarchaeota archaeon]
MVFIKVNRRTTIKEMLCSCEEGSDSEKYFKNLEKLGENLKLDDKINSTLIFLNALGNKERLTIINALKEKDRCVCELEVILDKSQPSISHHLRELEKANLIRGWKKGKFTYYSLLENNFKEQLENFYHEYRLG